MKPRRSMPPGTARSRLVTSWPAASSALMTTGPTPRSHDPVPPVTATFMGNSASDFVAVGRVVDRPIDEIIEIGGEGRAVEVTRGDTDEGAGEAAMRLVAAALVRQDRGIEHRA